MCGHAHFGSDQKLCNNLLAKSLCCLLHVIDSIHRMVVYTDCVYTK